MNQDIIEDTGITVTAKAVPSKEKDPPDPANDVAGGGISIQDTHGGLLLEIREADHVGA